MNLIYKIGSMMTVTGKTPADFDIAVNAAMTGGQVAIGVPYVFDSSICQSFVLKVLDTAEDDIVTQAVNDALNSGTVIDATTLPQIKAQAVQDAIAAGDVIAKP